MKNNNIVSKPKRIVGLYGGLLIFLVMLFFGNLDSSNPQVTNMMAVALLMAMWWITEVVPLAITSLLPVALFPALGIMSGKDVSATYFNHVIFLFIGGFLVAIAMEKWNLHKRIAVAGINDNGSKSGEDSSWFYACHCIVSMWISNTATAMMMVPILISIIQKLEESGGEKGVSRFSTGLLLGIAYSASIGGIATLVGTPPNLSFARIFQIMFPEAPAISFANWFFFALPLR
jgi:sodium-dependent dicarboxylate transporter 2/3/5